MLPVVVSDDECERTISQARGTFEEDFNIIQVRAPAVIVDVGQGGVRVVWV